MNDYLEYVLTRILATLKRNSNKENNSAMWEWIMSKSSETSINYTNLENMANTNLIFGFFGITITPPDQEALYKLAEHCGVRGLQNPEGAVNPCPFANKISYSNTELLSQIEDSIGFNIHLPSFTGNKQGMATDYGLITARHCYYLHLLKRITSLFPDRNTRIIEIGAGLGLLGYFLDKLGYKDYTIIDLARVNAVQAYFLAKNLPERDIIFSGDEDPFNEKYKDSLKILHVSDFQYVPKGRFDLMVNMDSFTEMKKEEAVNYIASDCAEYLLSVNHEQNDFRVVEIFKPFRKLIYRQLFWTRPGYVEEFYNFNI